MPIYSTTLRPGYLVHLSTTIKGNVDYVRESLNAEQESEESVVTRWETTKRIRDAKEHERASKVRSRARSLITGICSQTVTSGMLCPEEKLAELLEAVAQADALVEEFNKTARLSTVHVSVVKGKIEADDERAIRDISREVTDLLSAMEQGLKTLNVDAVRDAASKAREVSAMLGDVARARVSDAIDAVRRTAREIVKAGETVAEEIDRNALEAIARARTAFLDMSDAVEVTSPDVAGRPVEFVAGAVVAPQTPAATAIVE